MLPTVFIRNFDGDFHFRLQMSYKHERWRATYQLLARQTTGLRRARVGLEDGRMLVLVRGMDALVGRPFDGLAGGVVVVVGELLLADKLVNGRLAAARHPMIARLIEGT